MFKSSVNFRGIPAMIMFKDGQEIHRAIGLRGKRSWWPNSSRTSLDHGGRVSATRL